MAEKIIGIKLNDVDYDYEDSETKEKAGENAESIGDLSELETEEKTSLVGAINELASGGGGVKKVNILNVPLFEYGPGMDYYQAKIDLLSNGFVSGTIAYNANYVNTEGQYIGVNRQVINRSADFGALLESVMGEGIFPTTGQRYVNAPINLALFLGDPNAEDLICGWQTVQFTLYADKTASLSFNLSANVARTITAGEHFGLNPSIYFVVPVSF